MRIRRLALLGGLLVAGCATTAPSLDERGVTGTWQGWIIGERDFTPVSMEIRADGTFTMSAVRLGVARQVTGVVAVREGRPRIEGSGGWHGTMTVSGAPPHRALKIERDDRLYGARFTETAH
jgi:hypothetical protein